jgi:hypothetical protein
MCKATVNLISPSGVPVTLDVTNGDAHDIIIETMERADKIGAYFMGKGWTAAHPDTGAAGPSAGELAQGPTFAGYPCSPTVDAAGLPTWIIFEGKQAQRREKQGDVWYSVRGAGEGEYVQVLRIPKGEKAPEVRGL